MIHQLQTILYVSDQNESAHFYQKLFGKKPELHVPGMTEFHLTENVKLGLMPNKGIAKILKDKTPHPQEGNGIPRCELYLTVEDIHAAFENAHNCGATLIRPIEDRDWGATVCYFADRDGHILAFAQKL